jgi:hypothetical protein
VRNVLLDGGCFTDIGKGCARCGVLKRTSFRQGATPLRTVEMGVLLPRR